jgi:hypothetical protein
MRFGPYFLLLAALGGPLLTSPFLPKAEAQAQPGTVQQFQKTEDSWSVALVNKDQYGLENLMSPTFIDIAASGAVNTRNQSIADTLAGLPQPLLSVEQKVVNVRVVSDVAIVEGTYVMRLKQEARTRDERGIYTHVYQRSHNTWSCVSAQRTAVVDELEGGRGKAVSAGGSGASSEKKSNAALPFHIPLLYRGPDIKNPPAPSAAMAAPPQ